MKKKYRDIIVDGEKWAWNFYAKGEFGDFQSITIWKDKKTIFSKSFGLFGSNNHPKYYGITPGLISRFIRMYLKKLI